MKNIMHEATSSEHIEALRSRIESAFEDPRLLQQPDTRQAVIDTVALLDQGILRVAEPEAPGRWVTHAWVKQAVLLYFRVMEMREERVGPFEYFDKIPLKRRYA